MFAVVVLSVSFWC